MIRRNSPYDSIVIGGGFFGCCVALFLRRLGHQVLVIEKSGQLLTRASYANQARVHQGYHYPRSFVTGLRSAANFQRFVADFATAICKDFEKVYAIAAHNSKITANQFWKFCEKIQAPIQRAPKPVQTLFDRDRIDDVFVVREYAFDAKELRRLLTKELATVEIDVLVATEAERLAESPGNTGVRVFLSQGEFVDGQWVFNCTYGRINHLLKRSHLPPIPVKHEIAEIALVHPPHDLKNLGITLMDGPFFSIMPFPAEGLHSFSHVRYTPHQQSGPANEDQGYYNCMASPRTSNFPMMQNDAARYLPVARDCEYVRSLFEVKAILQANEQNDGRPILFRPDHGIKGLSIILGGKIDNIYDILQALQTSLGHAPGTGTFEFSARRSA